MRAKKLSTNKFLKTNKSSIGIAHLRRLPGVHDLVSTLISDGKMNAGRTILNLPWNYSPGYEELSVFIEGVLYNTDQDYTENAGNQITFTSPLSAGYYVDVLHVSDALPAYLSANEVIFSKSSNYLDSTSVQDAILEAWYPRGYIDGLVISNGTDSDHDIDVSVGFCRDSGNTHNIELSSSYTKQIDASWSVGTNAGGLFSGSVANDTWYHLFVIYDPTNHITDVGFDTSVTAGNRPAAYTKYRRIGSVLTDGSSNILAFKQFNDTFIWGSAPTDQSGAIGAATNITLSVPLGVETTAIIWASSVTSGASTLSLTGYYPNAGTDYITSVFNLDTQAAGDTTSSMWQCRTNTSSQIKAGDSNTSNTYLQTLGWIDPRGRDS